MRRHLSKTLALWAGSAIAVLVFCACSAPRKLSQVGLRVPAAVKDGPVVSPLRQELMATQEFAKACPAEVKAELAGIASLRLQFPDCPEGFRESFQNSLIYLKLEERSTLEEVLGSRCRSLGLGEFGDSVEQLNATFETTGPIGRRSLLKETLVSQEAELATLSALKVSIEEIVGRNLPLERWSRRYGSFVLPEEDLRYLHGLVVKRHCQIGEEEVDEAYRSLRGLEDLSKILRDGPERDRIQNLLSGVHKVIDRRIQEFFQP